MRINTILPIKGKMKVVSIFSYSTKGIPGIEIKGLGSHGQLIKEKLIYLTRYNHIRMPLKRFVICVDLPASTKVESETARWLELPVLLLFWQMLEVLPIGKLDDCFAAGSVSSNGKVTPLNLRDDDLIQLNNILKRTFHMQMKYFASENVKLAKEIYCIPLEKIFSGKKVKFS